MKLFEYLAIVAVALCAYYFFTQQQQLEKVDSLQFRTLLPSLPKEVWNGSDAQFARTVPSLLTFIRNHPKVTSKAVPRLFTQVPSDNWVSFRFVSLILITI
jgi:hypothetical protein